MSFKWRLYWSHTSRRSFQEFHWLYNASVKEYFSIELWFDYDLNLPVSDDSIRNIKLCMGLTMVDCQSISCTIKFVKINCINVVYNSNNQKGFIANLWQKLNCMSLDTPVIHILHITSVDQLLNANEMCLCKVQKKNILVFVYYKQASCL